MMDQQNIGKIMFPRRVAVFFLKKLFRTKNKVRKLEDKFTK